MKQKINKNMVGCFIKYWDKIWEITDINYLGDYAVEREEIRSGKRIKIRSSISKEMLDESHPHHWNLTRII